jgi:hypothetical protein
MTNERMSAALRVLSLLAIMSSASKPKLTPLVCFKIVELNMKYGISNTMPVAMAWYGVILRHAGRPVTEALKYGDIALRLQDELKCNESKAQVAAIYHGMINTYGINFSDCIKPLHVGLDDGLQAGDVRHAVVCAHLISFFSFHSGIELAQVAATLDIYIRLMREYNVTAVLWVNLMYKQVANNLTVRLRSPQDKVKPNRRDYIIKIPPNSTPIENEHGWSTQALQAYMVDDYKLVWEASEKFYKLVGNAAVSICTLFVHILITLELLSHIFFIAAFSVNIILGSLLPWNGCTCADTNRNLHD